MRISRLFRRLDRYVLGEILGPLALGFLVYTFILLLQTLFKFAQMIIQQGVPAGMVGRLLLLSLPNIVVLTIPMSLLFGILIAIGRLSSDSELTAMRSSGISMLSMYRPILLVSALFTVLNLYLMIVVLPRGNTTLEALRLEIITRDVTQLVEPRVFNEQFEGRVLYVFDVPRGGHRWKGVFFADSLPTTENEVTVADTGEIRVDAENQRLILHLENAVTHRVDFSDPDRYEIIHHQSLDRRLDVGTQFGTKPKISVSRDLRSLPVPELLQRIDAPGLDPRIRSQALVELHKKFAIPFACMAFGICALPLALDSRRGGGKSTGFAISILVILVYYILLKSGEESAAAGSLSPLVAMWMPNILLGIGGAILLYRRNRERPPILAGLDLRIGTLVRITMERRRQRRREMRRQRAASVSQRPAQPHVVLRLPRLRWRFPKTIDRYILKLFASILVLVLMSVLTIYIVADVSENMDDVLKNHVSGTVVFNYYKFLSLQIAYDMAPVAVLVTTLITFSLLSRRNEVTACRSLGISLYRLSLPAIVAAIAVAAFAVYLQSEVLPASNEQVARLKDQIRARETPRTYRRADRQWLFGRDRFMYNYLRYDGTQHALDRLQAFEFDADHRLVGRILADRAVFKDGRWIFENGWARSFDDGNRAGRYRRFSSPTVVDYPEPPEYFESDISRPEQMSYGELRDYVQLLRQQTGKVPAELEVELQSKVAFPVMSIVMALVGLPFAFRLGRRGALYGIGVSIVMGMVFLAVYAFFTTMGTAGILPPIVAVWSPNALFALLSMYLYFGMPT